LGGVYPIHQLLVDSSDLLSLQGEHASGHPYHPASPNKA
jgi:hypothetical protein